MQYALASTSLTYDQCSDCKRHSCTNSICSFITHVDGTSNTNDSIANQDASLSNQAGEEHDETYERSPEAITVESISVRKNRQAAMLLQKHEKMHNAHHQQEMLPSHHDQDAQDIHEYRVNEICTPL